MKPGLPLGALAAVLLALVFARPADAFIYWANLGDGDALGRATLQGTGANHSFITGPSSTCGVAVDDAHIYWANQEGGSIGRANLDGTEVDPDFITGALGPCGVAVDDTHIYWGNSWDNSHLWGLGRARIDGTNVDQRYIAGAEGADVCGVAVDDTHIYWASQHALVGGDTIGRANLDGSEADNSFITGADAPCGVAVDDVRIYWANSDSIGRAFLSGTGANHSFIPGANDACGVALDDTHLYWGNASIFPEPTGTIGRANLDGSGADQSFVGGADHPCGVAVDSLALPACAGVDSGTPFNTPASLRLDCAGPGTLSYELVTQPAGGELSNFDPSSGTLTYTPNFGFTGADSFTYGASSSFGGSNTATVTITVNPLPPAGGLVYRGCVANGGGSGCADPDQDPLAGAVGVAVAPDGADVYAAALQGNSVSQLSRDPSDGSLTLAGCVADAGAGGCDAPTNDSLAGANSLAVDQGGSHVVVAGGGPDGTDGSVTNLRRASDGSLDYGNCVTVSGGPAGCTSTHDALAGAAGVATAGEPASVYVAAADADAVVHLSVDSDSGDLTFADCVANEGANECADPGQDALDEAAGIAAAGADVYVASTEANSVSHLSRGADGSLTFSDCVANAGGGGCTDPAEDALAGATGVAISPDGRDVYVASVDANSVSHFSRAAGGSLDYRSCVADGGAAGCAEPANSSLEGASGVAISPDGAHVYVTSQGANAVSHFSRAPDGSLIYRSCVADGGARGCATPTHDSLEAALGVAVSPDGPGSGGRPGGRDVYVASFSSQSVSHLARVPASPTFSGTSPSSPSTSTQPRILGSAVSGSTVNLYTTSDCSGPPAATGTAAELGSPGIQVTVPAGSTTTFHATATVDGQVSECSTDSIAYAVLAPPTFSGTAPPSPSADTQPRILGEAASGSTVTLYTTSDCSGPAAATGSAAEFASPGILVTVPAGSMTTFHATAAVDDDVTGCSTDSIAYTARPPAPSFSESAPPSPSGDTQPRILGSAPSGSTVALYTGSDCSGSASATGSAAEFASPGIQVSVPANSTTTFRATATVDGQVSDCSADTIAYTALPAPPTCEDIPITTPNATPAPVSLECSGDGTLTYAVVAQPDHGDVADFDTAAGRLVYTPDAGFTGEDSFTYRASNSGGNSATATVTITVEPDPPSCQEVPVSIPHDTPAEISLECSGQGPLTHELLTQPLDGAVSDFDAAAGRLVYTPDAGFTGEDSFTYRASNSAGDSNTATVTITVEPDPPSCESISVSIPRDKSAELELECSGEGPLTYAVVSHPGHGEISDLDPATGTLTYTPAAGYTGRDSFTYQASNNGGNSNTATVAVTVDPALPRCEHIPLSTPENRPAAVKLDCAGQGALTYAVVAQPAHGTLSNLDPAAGTLTYTPASSFAGFDSFAYRASNAAGNSNPATVTIAVLPIPPLPPAPPPPAPAPAGGPLLAPPPGPILRPTPASNRFRFGKLKRNKRRGTARLIVRVPGPGRVRLAKTKRLRRAAKRATKAGAVRLVIRPRGKARKRLRRRGAVRVRAKVTYAPRGGKPRTRTKTVKLKQKRRR